MRESWSRCNSAFLWCEKGSQSFLESIFILCFSWTRIFLDTGNCVTASLGRFLLISWEKSLSEIPWGVMNVWPMSWMHWSSVSTSMRTSSKRSPIFLMVSLRQACSSLCWCNFSCSFVLVVSRAVCDNVLVFIILLFLILWCTWPSLQFTEKAVSCVLFVSGFCTWNIVSFGCTWSSKFLFNCLSWSSVQWKSSEISLSFDKLCSSSTLIVVGELVSDVMEKYSSDGSELDKECSFLLMME